MSSTIDPGRDVHAETQQLLPWLLAGTLEGGELAMVQRHLETCDQCRAELAWERKLRAAGACRAKPVSEPKPRAAGAFRAEPASKREPRAAGACRTEPASKREPRDAGECRPEPASKREPRDAGECRAVPAPERKPRAPGECRTESASEPKPRTAGQSPLSQLDCEAALARLLPRLGPQMPRPPGILERWLGAVAANDGWLRMLAGAQFAAIAVLALLLIRPATDGASYRTLGAPASAAATVVVTFRPETPEQELRRILQASDARVIDGPTVTGAYVLAVPKARTSRALDQLRGEPAVTLAQPLAPARAP